MTVKVVIYNIDGQQAMKPARSFGTKKLEPALITSNTIVLTYILFTAFRNDSGAAPWTLLELVWIFWFVLRTSSTYFWLAT